MMLRNCHNQALLDGTYQFYHHFEKVLFLSSE
jgi:hypothetical protein